MAEQKPKRSEDPRVTQVLKELAGSISKVMGSTTVLSTAVPGLKLYRNTAPTAPNPCSYELRNQQALIRRVAQINTSPV